MSILQITHDEVVLSIVQLTDDVVETCNNTADVSPEFICEEFDAREELGDFVLSKAALGFGMWEGSAKQTLEK